MASVEKTITESATLVDMSTDLSKGTLSLDEFWAAFTGEAASWEWREKALRELRMKSPSLYVEVLHLYREKMRDVVEDAFFVLVGDDNALKALVDSYANTGELSIQFLDKNCLPQLASQTLALEPIALTRYGHKRPVYPPREVQAWDPATDERCHLFSDTQMSAVGQNKLDKDCTLQWIYHLPHLCIFIQKVMRFPPLFTFEYSVGIGMNIMRPATEAHTALRFHFDWINSDNASEDTDITDEEKDDGHTQALRVRLMDATAIVGIQDCIRGGERVMFNGITRSHVSEVWAVLEKFSSSCPEREIQFEKGALKPAVVTENVSGLLSIFDGGNRLHAVSAVKEGMCVAVPFMFPTVEPGRASAKQQLRNSVRSRPQSPPASPNPGSSASVAGSAVALKKNLRQPSTAQRVMTRNQQKKKSTAAAAAVEGDEGGDQGEVLATNFKGGVTLRPPTNKEVRLGMVDRARLEEYVGLLNNEILGEEVMRAKVALVVNMEEKTGIKQTPGEPEKNKGKARFFIKGGEDKHRYDIYAGVPSLYAILMAFI
uniref:Uncharacterized protein n=1 Tax=Chromera velia CCMP2878 TaxID=1169474 RepID=A0A0G4FGE8_9ALVE|eukprot:Cvel_3295.t1-p1 / transcript=Cvel_3295.t1 / gene=Cvel_3295 / organism=Chromera_velia_CCMP2878 / gene_product=hypothetical protein / transcript_product=hypothetical protein / location=Cvel_scaffold130:38564-55159(-) / protein_length=542 / sequence_SO=supercontig / SO=protein_coding / is_pseudo=false